MSVEEYCTDVLIIGGGAAGAVLASRITEDPRIKVILLEAGQDSDNDPVIVAPNPNIDINIYGPAYFWQGNTIPNPDANNRVFPWTNGRLLGGGTSIFGMLYTRGSKERFDEWTPFGPNWNGTIVMDTYKRMEKFDGLNFVTDPQNHGTTGRMAIRLGVSDSSSTQQYVDAIVSLGLPGIIEIDDYNNPATPIGYFRNWQYFQFPDQTRASSSRTYLSSDVKSRRNLKILTQTTATKLIWKKNENKVKGSYALRNGNPIRINASKKTIVSAGFNSPAFLQVNGIGPAPTLTAAKVPIRVNLPGVGRNIENGYYVVVIMIAPPGTTKNSQPGSFNEFGAFLPDPRNGSDPNIRRVQLSTSLRDNIPGLPLVSIFILEPLRLKSRGSVDIQNADPLKIAEADIGFLHNPDDMDLTIAAFNSYITPMITYLFNNFGYFPIFPSFAVLNNNSDLEDFIRSSVGNGHHYQCFNRMGPSSDPNAVVDQWGP